jgi:heme/copper-type cytochrome/quinol oxidase subunit 1
MELARLQRLASSMPVLWLLAAILASAVSAADFGRGTIGDPTLHETYYIFSRAHYSMSLAGLCVAFAIIYLVADRALHLTYRRRLGVAHFSVTFFGVLLVLSPTVVAALASAFGSTLDVQTSFTALTTLAMIGYAMIYVGLVVFVALVVDAVRGRRAPKGDGAR